MSQTNILQYRFLVIDGDNGALVITSVEEFHAGEYACRARNRSVSGCVKDSDNATLTVQGTC